MNEQLRKDIRAEIEKVKELKRSVGEINSHLNIIESLCAFDNEALEQREKEAYQRGLDDTWYAARKVALNELPNGERGLGMHELLKVFKSSSLQEVFRTYSASEVISKLKDCEEKKDDGIRVGDVVAFRATNEKGIATRVDEHGANVLQEDGQTGYYLFELLKKTDKHDSSIEAILKRIRYENN